jgi:hypothetical protein
MAMKRWHGASSGMAALFDALMFLSVMSVISVTVLVAFTPAHGTDRNVQSYVQKCHSVLLSTTLRSWSESSEKTMPVSDAIATLLFIKTPLPDRIRSEIEMMLQGLFLPQFAAEWRCSMGNSSFVFGGCDGNSTGGNIFVSTLSVAAPSGLCSYVLTVRYA